MRSRAWWRALLLRRRQEREMREEMDQHIERAVERLLARGLAPAEAERQAHREFGNMDWIRENARDARGHRWIETLAADVRYALRQFRRTPLSAFAMMLILSLGIGASTGLFAVLHSMRTQPPPGVERDDALVRIRGIGGPFRYRQLSHPEVRSYAALGDVFDGVAAYGSASLLLRHRDAADVVTARGEFVSDVYFDLLGVRPALGTGLPRVARPEDALTAVINYAMWQSAYGGRTDVIGEVVHLNDVPVTIVGVAPRDFAGVRGGRAPPRLLWLPLEARIHVAAAGPAFLSSADSTMFHAVARVRPGVALAHADAVARAVGARYMRSQDGTVASDVVPLLHENQNPGNDDAFVMLAAVFGTLCLIILLITCTNVSTLLAGMAAVRRREIAVRLTLGAGRPRVVRQLLVESSVLALGAGLIAFVVTTIVLRAVAERTGEVLVVSWPAAVWTAGIALVAALIFGLAPALHATRLGVADVLKDSAASITGSRSMLQRVLIVLQVMVTQPLLVALAALLVGGAAELRARSNSPVRERLVTLEFSTWAGNATREERRADWAALADRIRGMPGVVGAVALSNGYRIETVVVHPADRITDRAASPLRLRGEFAAPGYFALTGIPLVSGREFDERDDGAIIIGADLARSLWGSANPIGRRFVRASGDAVADSAAFTVVGVVDDAVAGASTTSGRERVFVKVPEDVGSILLVRTVPPATSMFPAFRSVAAEAAPSVPLAGIRTLAQEEAEMLRFLMRMGSAAAVGGLLALFLAAFGLYAVISHAVRQRQREIGIRTALGADRARVARMFFRSGLGLSALGLALGLPLSVFTLHVLTAQSGLPPTDLTAVSALVAIAVIVVAAAASWLPARAAARVDPLEALRVE
jgi:predicted permease